MNSLWKSSSGRLIVGGCGAQVGFLLSLAGLGVGLFLCALCAFSSLLTIDLTEEIAQAATPASIKVSAPAEDIQLVWARVDLLVEQVRTLRANMPVIPTPTATPLPLPPQPIAIAKDNAVNLRSGPGMHYNRLGRMVKGETLEIVGRNNDSTWWLVATPDGHFAWVSDMAVATFNINASLPVVAIPALLVQAVPGAPVIVTSAPTPASVSEQAVTTLEVVYPTGTPTAIFNQGRRFVQDTLGYKQLIRRLLLPTVSESFSPHGDQIAITEKIKLYTITPDGATSRSLLEDDQTVDLIGGVVWSPDGRYLAFIAEQTEGCDPCRRVGLVRLADGNITYLQPPAPDAGIDLPRWTQTGQLLVTVFWDQPSNGAVYIYDISGQGQPASGSYLLGSSHDGQKWTPWQPGKTWQASNTEPVDSYYRD